LARFGCVDKSGFRTRPPKRWVSRSTVLQGSGDSRTGGGGKRAEAEERKVRQARAEAKKAADQAAKKVMVQGLFGSFRLCGEFRFQDQAAQKVGELIHSVAGIRGFQDWGWGGKGGGRGAKGQAGTCRGQESSRPGRQKGICVHTGSIGGCPFAAGAVSTLLLL
jgi:hypothetical protein